MNDAVRNAVGWFEIYVDDLEAARRFYEAVFEVTLAPIEMPVSDMIMLGFPMSEEGAGAPGALVKMAGMELPSPPGRVMVYFSCADCAVEAGRVGACGGRVMREKFSIGPYGFIAIVADPDGNMLGLHSLQ